jgi:hypothetical protein
VANVGHYMIDGILLISGVAVLDSRIFVLGGEEGWDRYHDTIECYSAETDSWQLTGDMPTSRSWLSCVPLQVRKPLSHC